MMTAATATKTAPRAGFTLLEMAIVVAIIAVTTAMGMYMGNAMINSAKVKATSNRLDTIQNALYAYRVANNRLPCPADITLTPSSSNYGVEAAVPGTCTGGTPAANFSKSFTNVTGQMVEGGVPTQALSLPASFMYDAWGRKFDYAVWSAMTSKASSTLSPAGFQQHGLATNCGEGIVNNAGGTPITTAADYVLVSAGPDGHGGFTSSGTRYNAGSDNAGELTNCHCTQSAAENTYNATYVQKNPTIDPQDSADIFDDIVRFKERAGLINAQDKYVPGGTSSCLAGADITGVVATSIAYGDINGDGITDMVISTGGTTLYVIFGNKLGFPNPLPVASLDGTNGFTITGVTAGGPLAVGDVNGDGIADIVTLTSITVDDVALRGEFGQSGSGSDGTWRAVTVILGGKGAWPATVDATALEGYNSISPGANGTNGSYFIGLGVGEDGQWGATSSASLPNWGTPLTVGNLNGAANGSNSIADIVFGNCGLIPSTYSSGVCVVFGHSGGWLRIYPQFLQFSNSQYWLFDFMKGLVMTIRGTSPAPSPITGIAIGDINGDNIPDMVIDEGGTLYGLLDPAWHCGQGYSVSCSTPGNRTRGGWYAGDPQGPWNLNPQFPITVSDYVSSNQSGITHMIQNGTNTVLLTDIFDKMGAGTITGTNPTQISTSMWLYNGNPDVGTVNGDGSVSWADGTIWTPGTSNLQQIAITSYLNSGDGGRTYIIQNGSITLGFINEFGGIATGTPASNEMVNVSGWSDVATFHSDNSITWGGGNTWTPGFVTSFSPLTVTDYISSDQGAITHMIQNGTSTVLLTDIFGKVGTGTITTNPTQVSTSMWLYNGNPDVGTVNADGSVSWIDGTTWFPVTFPTHQLAISKYACSGGCGGGTAYVVQNGTNAIGFINEQGNMALGNPASSFAVNVPAWSGSPDVATFNNTTPRINWSDGAIWYGPPPPEWGGTCCAVTADNINLFQYGSGLPNYVSIADINGDHFGDMLLWSNGSGSPGTVSPIKVIYGGVNGYNNGWGNITINQEFDVYGMQSLNLGDINGDGIPDLLIGDGANSMGFVVYGSKAGWSTPLAVGANCQPCSSATLNGTNGFQINNGGTVLGLTDVTQDGFPDLFIGGVNGTKNYILYGVGNPTWANPDDFSGL